MKIIEIKLLFSKHSTGDLLWANIPPCPVQNIVKGWKDERQSIIKNSLNQIMAHSAVWGHSPIRRQNTNSKTLMIEKMSKSGLRRCTKFGQAHSNDERKITLPLILHFILDFWI